MLQQIQATAGLQQLMSQAWLPLEHEPHDPAAPPSAVPPALRYQLHQSQPVAGLPKWVMCSCWVWGFGFVMQVTWASATSVSARYLGHFGQRLAEMLLP